MAALGFSGSLPPETDRQESLWGVDEGSEDVEHVRFFRLNPIVAGVILTARQHQGNVGGHTLPDFCLRPAVHDLISAASFCR
jgi:hypothetical protein